MNIKKLFLLLIVLYPINSVFCQRIVYTYDDNGNRKNRTIDAERLRSESINFPVTNLKKLLPSENTQGSATHETLFNENTDKQSTKTVTSEFGVIKTNVFPNPTSGMIKIQVDNMPLNIKTEARFYDLSGNILLIRQDLGPTTDIDLNNIKDGIYILRIKIDNKWFDWKVVINH